MPVSAIWKGPGVTTHTGRAWLVLEPLEPFPIESLLEAGRQLLAAVSVDSADGLIAALLIDRSGTQPAGTLGLGAGAAI